VRDAALAALAVLKSMGGGAATGAGGAGRKVSTAL